jgi:hypothetical protein
MTTTEDHIGLGPTLAKSGDIIIVFPGCMSLIVLRETNDSKYKVIGDCLIEEFSHSKALLGLFPDRYGPLFETHDDPSERRYIFRNGDTGEVRAVDPRVEGLRSEAGKDGVRRLYVENPVSGREGRGVRMWTSIDEKEEFLLMGLDVKAFDLI